MKYLLKNTRTALLMTFIAFGLLSCTEDAALQDVIDNLQEVPTLDTDDKDKGDHDLPTGGS